MNAFYSIFKVELLLYRRSIWLWVALAVLTGYLFLGYNAFLSVNIEVGQFLQSSGYIGMAAAIVGFLMGMLSARREHSHGFSETLSSIPGDSVRGAAKLAAWTVVVLLFTFVAALEMVVLILYVNSEFVYFWDMISSYILLYWGMTLLSCGYIGYALETLFPSRWWNLLIIFSIWVLISPMNYFILLLAPSSDAIHWSSVPLSYLNQGERNLESAYQEVQGLHISFDIWMKKIFFYLFSICIVCFVSMKQKHREKTKKERQSIVYISVACMVLIIIVAALARTPLDSEILTDYEAYYEDKDRTFYQTPQQMEPVLSDSASIKVNAYHVELSHYKNEIAYSASLDISLEKKKGDWLPFTLYHGLHVTNVRISDTSAKWSRNGDTLYIEWPDIIGKSQISMDINGHTGALHPIKGNSYFLAADFPWLPVPGSYKVAEISAFNGLLTYNPIPVAQETEYRITVRNSSTVYSNLPEITPNVFAGKAKGASLLSGILLEKESNNMITIRPPDRLENIETFLSHLQEKVDQTAALLAVDSIDLTSNLEKIFVVPTYSYESRYRMKFIDGQLYLNDKFGSSEFQASSEIPSVFYSFFWNNQYRDRDAYNSFILSTLIEFLALPDENTLLKRLVDDIERRREHSDPVQYLFKDIMDAYNQGYAKEIHEWLQDMYDLLQQKDMSLEDWNSMLAIKLQERSRQ